MKRGTIVWFAVFLAMTVGILSCSSMKQTPSTGAKRMSLDALKSKLSDSAVVVIDVRTGNDWEDSRLKIEGAIRENPKADAAAWSAKYDKDKTYVLYCA